MLSVLFSLVIAIVIVGFLCWLIRKLPIDEPFKSVAQGVLVFFLVLYVIFVVASLLNVPDPFPVHRLP